MGEEETSDNDHLVKLIAHLQGRRTITPKSQLGKALNYACAQWPHLESCFMGGQIQFNNNLTEEILLPNLE